jgi:hypothetical protein
MGYSQRYLEVCEQIIKLAQKIPNMALYKLEDFPNKKRSLFAGSDRYSLGKFF